MMDSGVNGLGFQNPNGQGREVEDGHGRRAQRTALEMVLPQSAVVVIKAQQRPVQYLSRCDSVSDCHVYR